MLLRSIVVLRMIACSIRRKSDHVTELLLCTYVSLPAFSADATKVNSSAIRMISLYYVRACHSNLTTYVCHSSIWRTPINILQEEYEEGHFKAVWVGSQVSKVTQTVSHQTTIRSTIMSVRL